MVEFVVCKMENKKEKENQAGWHCDWSVLHWQAALFTKYSVTIIVACFHTPALRIRKSQKNIWLLACFPCVHDNRL